MGDVFSQLSVSLDGYVAAPGQSVQDPLGRGGLRLHEWAFATESWRAQHGLADGERTVDAEVIGGGTPLFDGPLDVALAPEKVVAAPGVTHLRYRVRH
ncbi:hypothetical protein [Micromonospora sp. WMMD980]|uniref:hypothetical protein n=1 Tax=Micromonospora sp. WMMD980 TaxID=3016088 RepID=UPI00241728C5|nr:hypothetical protein [Micromonospora sp. WMMD980]MDG4803290.1 hypothetical protein [Micromonospora sp. WMMD980]